MGIAQRAGVNSVAAKSLVLSIKNAVQRAGVDIGIAKSLVRIDSGIAES